MTYVSRNITGFVLIILISCVLYSCKSGSSGLVDRPVELIKVADGFKFAEGPAADSRGDLYFSDIPGSRCYKWTSEGGLEVYRENTSRGNGIYFGPDDEMFTCETDSRQITRTIRAGQVDVITNEYQGKRYNRPNDLWIDEEGGIYFTDPSYYMKEEDIGQDAEAVYYILPGWEEAKRVTGHITRPNGIMGTADGKTLYVVSDTAHQTWKFRIMEDGSLEEKELFVANGHDGLTLDEKGNLYIANRDSLSVDIYDSQGRYLERIIFPEEPSNVCFAGKEKNMLYVTAVSSVYGVRMNVAGQ